jgi:hypothetical protein
MLYSRSAHVDNSAKVGLNAGNVTFNARNMESESVHITI